jgi:hypothetical protein
MDEKRVIEALSVHADELIGRPEATEQISLTDEERCQLTPLFQLAQRLHRNMQPVYPSAAFVRNLGQELVDTARRQVALTKRLRRAVLIGAAALGSLLSIASVVGAIVFVIVRWRERMQAQTVHAPTG